MMLRQIDFLEIYDDEGQEHHTCNHCGFGNQPKNPLPHNHLVEYEPPICNVCNNEMNNVQTTNGVRQYQCTTWECTNHRYYDVDGNELRKKNG